MRRDTVENMKRIQFPARISKSGTKRIIVIPANLHNELQELEKEYINVILEPLYNNENGAN